MIKDILSFLANPFTNNNTSISMSLIVFLKTIVLYVVFVVVWGLVKYILSKFGFSDGGLSINMLLYENSLQLLELKGVVVFINLIVILIPIWEEISFRLLLSFRKWHVIISSVSTIVLINFLFFRNVIYAGVLLACLLLVIAVTQRTITPKVIDKFQKQYGVSLFYLRPFFFALCHLKQLCPLRSTLIVEYIMYLIPLVVFGYFSSYIRIKVGFIFSVVFHVMLNGVMTLLFIFSIHS